MNNPKVIAEWQRRQNKAKKQSIVTFFELKKSVSDTEKSAGSPFEEERNRWYRVRCPQGWAKLKTTQTKLSQTALQYERKRQARWKERKRMGLRRKKKLCWICFSLFVSLGAIRTRNVRVVYENARALCVWMLRTKQRRDADWDCVFTGDTLIFSLSALIVPHIPRCMWSSFRHFPEGHFHLHSSLCSFVCPQSSHYSKTRWTQTNDSFFWQHSCSIYCWSLMTQCRRKRKIY